MGTASSYEEFHLKLQVCCANYFRHFNFLSVFEEYKDSDISSQMESICLLSSFATRCDETLRNLCSQVFAIFTEGIVNLSKLTNH